MLNERYLTLRFRQQKNYIIVFGLKKVKRDMMVNKKKFALQILLWNLLFSRVENAFFREVYYQAVFKSDTQFCLSLIGTGSKIFARKAREDVWVISYKNRCAHGTWHFLVQLDFFLQFLQCVGFKAPKLTQPNEDCLLSKSMNTTYFLRVWRLPSF